MSDSTGAVENSSGGAAAFHDRSFGGLTAGQFLGAFNDNLFKQLVLLLCVDVAVQRGLEPNSYQSLAQVTFALPWVLFSGLAGFVADRTSKQAGIVLYKALEIGITLSGVLAFRTHELWPVFVVLFLLSLHSTFFGPCKYGVLPELFQKRDLPQINGVFQMTTFLAIILGQAAAGFGKERLEGDGALWKLSLASVVIAVFGLMCVLLVRKTKPAQPNLRFDVSALGLSADTWRMLRNDRFLLGVLLLTSVFWFLGGVVNLSVNVLGKVELGLADGRTSLLLSFLSIGIALGCVAAGKLSSQRINFGVVRAGAWGIVVGCLALVVISVLARSAPTTPIGQEAFSTMLHSRSWPEFCARAAMVVLGASAGLFVVPLQVVLQSSPPEEFKGRMIGTMNLVNWIGILLSAVFVGVIGKLIAGANTLIVSESCRLPPSAIFGLLAVLTLPIALLYRPADRELK